MSGQATPARIKTSPKQGPMKATIPIASVTKEGSDLLRKSTSPTICWGGKARMSPPESAGQRSPGSSAHKGKTKSCNKINEMRRTASLDTVYLKGLFPKEGFSIHRDRSTQTEISSSLDSLQKIRSLDGLEDTLGKLTLRQKKRSTSRDSALRHLSPDDQMATTSSQTISSFSPSNKASTSKSSRSSEEGLNQEIERIIKSESDPKCSDRLREPTPEGRKAPIADILRIAEFSHSASPDQDRQDASPRINKLFSREPPDGCERVALKARNIIKPVPIEGVAQPRAFFQLKPSSHSAFETLNPPSTSSDDNKDNDKEDSPKVPK